MARILRTSQISTKLEGNIEGANWFLFLTSPYLKINTLIKPDIKELDNRELNIHIVYFKTALNDPSCKACDHL